MKITTTILLAVITFQSLQAQHNSSEIPLAIGASGNLPDQSAILDVSSDSKGVLIPRMTSSEREAILNPSTGLLVYDTDNNGFVYYANTKWNQIVTGISSLISDLDDDTKVTTEETDDEDLIKLQIHGENRFTVNHNVTFDNTRFVTDFNFGNLFIGYDAGIKYDKASSTVLGQNVYLGVNAGRGSKANSYGNVYVGYNSGLVDSIGNSNTFIGNRSGQHNQGANNNSFLGYYSGFNNISGRQNTFLGTFSGSSNTEGSSNTYVGFSAGGDNTDGGANTIIGYAAGSKTLTGDANTYIGFRSGDENSSGELNTFVGYSSGRESTGSRNVFIGIEAGRFEVNSNRLYIENSDNSNPLIYGEFDTNKIQINGSMKITEFVNLQPLDSAPTSPNIGTIYYDSIDNKVKVWIGSAWENLN